MLVLVHTVLAWTAGAASQQWYAAAGSSALQNIWGCVFEWGTLSRYLVGMAHCSGAAQVAGIANEVRLPQVWTLLTG